MDLYMQAFGHALRDKSGWTMALKIHYMETIPGSSTWKHRIYLCQYPIVTQESTQQVFTQQQWMICSFESEGMVILHLRTKLQEQLSMTFYSTYPWVPTIFSYTKRVMKLRRLFQKCMYVWNFAAHYPEDFNFFQSKILHFSILLHCIVQWILQVMFPSACSFIVLVFAVFHYMFRPTWRSSGV
jgi:hypothetical protein